MKPRLKGYGFASSVVERARPVVQALESRGKVEFRRELSRVALDLCTEIAEGAITPQAADDIFTLIDLYLGDAGAALEPDVCELLHEGMTLHHFGDPLGPTLAILREAAMRVGSRS